MKCFIQLRRAHVPGCAARPFVCLYVLHRYVPFAQEVESWVLGNAARHACHDWLGQACGPALVVVATS